MGPVLLLGWSVAWSGPRPPAVACTVSLPAPWVQSPSAMPDHVLEALWLEPLPPGGPLDGSNGATGTLIVRDAEGTLAAAAEAERARAPTATEEQVPDGFVWTSIAAGRRSLVYATTRAGHVVVVRVQMPEAAPTEALRTALAGLECRVR